LSISKKEKMHELKPPRIELGHLPGNAKQAGQQPLRLKFSYPPSSLRL
jgi:hypothetical protein